MSDPTDRALASLLLILADWSLRWAVLIAALAAWLWLRAPRNAATSALLCRLALAGGLLLPLLPCCWGPTRVTPPDEVSTSTAVLPDAPSPSSPSFHQPGPTRDLPPPPDPSPPPVDSGSVPPGEAEAPAPTPPGPGARSVAVRALAGLWAAGVLLGLARLVVGHALLARLRRSARPAGTEAQALLGRCRTELGLRRAVALLVHPGVGSPVVASCGRAFILVPPSWEEMSEEARRLSLLHELLHLARRDDWARLGEEFVRAVFFFHPLVRWLLARLDAERERLCDAALVRGGVEPRALAGVLFEFARAARPPRAALGRAALLPLFNRLTVKDRICRLLEDDMGRWSKPLSRGRRAALVAAVLGPVLALGSLGLRAAPAEPAAPPPPAPPAPAAPPPALPVPGAGLEGKLVDRAGRPVAGARVCSLCRTGACAVNATTPVPTDAGGRFRLAESAEGPIVPGKVVALRVVTAGGHSYEVNVVPTAGAALVRLPTLLRHRGQPPKVVAVGELAGVVVDAAGRPLEGVEVDVWDWYPGNETRTGKDGVFRLPKLGRDSRVQVRFRKPGYSPEMFVQQPTGVAGWVVALDKKTAFEGVVRGPDGKPAAGALIRANQGPRRVDGGIITTIWTDTRSDQSGKYRLPVQPDEYEFLVKAPGVGVARLDKTAVAHGEARKLDLRLQRGVTFRAVAVDSVSGKPVSGVRLWHWQHKDVEGRTDAKGEVAIGEMLPGRFEFQVRAAGYARWWSEEAASEWNRKRIDRPNLGWQRNFDDLDFDLKLGMAPVKIVLEKGARVRGKVLDPDGKPVAEATVAPALTGTGNSLTGDTRFSMPTKADGTFEVLLPASNGARYNLVAHDGKYGQWRRWANGVLPPFQTKPGQTLDGVTLRLTRPAVVRGKVVDAKGKPVAHREVRAHAADKLENRYYDPTTTTKADGTFELRLVRPGEHYVQAAPFWLTAEEAPPRSTVKVTLKAGETRAGVELLGVDPAR